MKDNGVKIYCIFGKLVIPNDIAFIDHVKQIICIFGSVVFMRPYKKI